MTLSPQLFSLLTTLVEERSGLHYQLVDLALIESKVVNRAVESNFDSLLDYYYFIRYDPAGSQELDRLVEALVVHETFFFREAEQLSALIEVVIAPAVAQNRRPRVWCAACATGEEPYTLAMLLDERGLLSSVEIVASDISSRALDRARKARYGGRSLRSLPVAAKDRWLSPVDEGVEVAPRIRERVVWHRVNLVEPAAVEALGTFDAIVCRNVLIYFQDQAAIRVVETISSALREGGLLLVGVSESLLRFGTALRCEERAGTFFYQRASA